MSGKKKYLLLVGILIIASFLRLYHITTTPPGLYQDEAMDGNNALENIHTGTMKVFYPEDNGREGLYVNIVTLFIKALGGLHEPWVIRFPAAIFGILTVLGIYFFGAELFGANVGLLSAFLLATNFWHINFSRIGFRAIMAPFFLVWALYFLIKGFRKLQNGAPFPRATALHILGGILFGLGMYTYIAYRVSPALILLVFVFYLLAARKGVQRKKIFHSAAHFVFFSIIVCIPLGYYFFSHPGSFFGRTSQISVSNSETPLKDLAENIVKTLAMFNVHGDWNWRHNVSGAPELFWPVGMLFIIGMMIGIQRIVRKKAPSANNGSRTKAHIHTFASDPASTDNTFGFWILFAWFFLAMLPVVISNEGIPHALRSILMIPPVIIFAALGGVTAYNLIKKYIRSSRLNPFAALFLLLFVAQAYISYFVVWAQNPNVAPAFNADYIEVGRELNALPASVPKYVVIEAGGVDVRRTPMPAQSTMFVTDIFLSIDWQAKNIHYVLPQDAGKIPVGAPTFYLK